MAWNFHQYYTNRTDGLIGQLLLTEDQEKKLKILRKTVRLRTKNVFEEAKTIAREAGQLKLTQERVLAKLLNTNIQYLSHAEQAKVAQLIFELDDEAREEFTNLTPRFWTQGSFQYDTLNRPFHPGQEMDIDDGTYLPMPIFESEPKIGHTLLLLLVDSSLKSLVAENTHWHFEAKNTCGRLKLPLEKTHIDVPMYAIPKDQFSEKQVALESLYASTNRAMYESYDQFADELLTKSESYEVDSEHVNLALRDGDEKWLNSDPKIVEDWFNNSCSRIGRHLRKVCRFMKAWRDAQWDIGGPSSICLMAATVNILDRVPHDKDDLSETMKIVAKHIVEEFSKGVESPDHTDDKPLFPPLSEHDSRESDIMGKLEELLGILIKAEHAESKEEALNIINTAFGNRVTDHKLIVTASAAPAFKESPDKEKAPKKISKSMVSG